jgi:hypothetical protein
MIRLLAVLAVFSMGTFAQAQGNTIAGVFSIAQGGNVSLGAEFEHEMERNYGVGGFVRFFQKDDDAPGFSNGVTCFGADARVHLPQKRWDFSAAPGVSIINIDAVGRGDDSTTLGPSLFLTVAYQITDTMTVGLENQKYYVWFDKDYAGGIVDDLAFRFSASF